MQTTWLGATGEGVNLQSMGFIKSFGHLFDCISNVQIHQSAEMKNDE